MQYTGLSGFGSKGTSESLPQSEHVHGYIFLSSDMVLMAFLSIRTVIFAEKRSAMRLVFRVKESAWARKVRKKNMDAIHRIGISNPDGIGFTRCG